MAYDSITKNFYNTYPFPQYSPDDLKTNSWGDLIRQQLQRWGGGEPGNILDAGCGTGTMTLVLALEFPEARVTGINISDVSIEYAKTQASTLHIDNAKFYTMDVLSLDENIINTTFDLIVSKGVLHHTNDPVGGIEILSDLVAGNGAFFLSLYHPGRYMNSVRRLILSVLAGDDWEKRLALSKQYFPNTCASQIKHVYDRPSHIQDAWLADRFCVPIESYHSVHKQYTILRSLGFTEFATFPDMRDMKKLNMLYEKLKYLLQPFFKSSNRSFGGRLDLSLLDVFCFIEQIEQTAILAKK